MTMPIAVAISGRGSNLEALLHAVGPGAPAEVVLVLSDRSAAGLALAESRRISTAVLSNPANGEEWLGLLRRHRVELLVLAGYVELVSSSGIAASPRPILKIPSPPPPPLR